MLPVETAVYTTLFDQPNKLRPQILDRKGQFARHMLQLYAGIRLGVSDENAVAASTEKVFGYRRCIHVQVEIALQRIGEDRTIATHFDINKESREGRIRPLPFSTHL